MTAQIFDLAAERARRAVAEDGPAPTAYDRGYHTRLIYAGRYAGAEVEVVVDERFAGQRGVILGLSPISWRYQVLLHWGNRRLFHLQQLKLVWVPPYAGQVRRDPPPDDPVPAA